MEKNTRTASDGAEICSTGGAVMVHSIFGGSIKGNSHSNFVPHVSPARKLSESEQNSILSTTSLPKRLLPPCSKHSPLPQKPFPHAETEILQLPFRPKLHPSIHSLQGSNFLEQYIKILPLISSQSPPSLPNPPSQTRNSKSSNNTRSILQGAYSRMLASTSTTLSSNRRNGRPTQP